VVHAVLEAAVSAGGAPTLRLSAGAARLAERRGVAHWHVSLTHTHQTAIAMVVAEGVSTPASTQD
jgi:holo-[acyl-carrier protein] synthase